MFKPGVVQIPIVDCNFLVTGLVAPRTLDVSAPDVLSVPLGIICDVIRVFLVKDSF